MSDLKIGSIVLVAGKYSDDGTVRAGVVVRLPTSRHPMVGVCMAMSKRWSSSCTIRPDAVSLVDEETERNVHVERARRMLKKAWKSPDGFYRIETGRSWRGERGAPTLEIVGHENMPPGGL